jgi:cytoskeletal protein RodZ
MSVANENNALQLAVIRQTRGISLEQIAQDTKISVRSLQAIENGEFKKLPGGIYNTSYIRQYARAIDFDEAELLAHYHAKVGFPPENPEINGKSGENISNFRFLLQH